MDIVNCGVKLAFFYTRFRNLQTKFFLSFHSSAACHGINKLGLDMLAKY